MKNETREKIFGWVVIGVLIVMFIALLTATVGLIHALVCSWKNDSKNEYVFSSAVLHITDDTYAVVSDEGNVFTFNSTEEIPANIQVRVRVDKGTSFEVYDDTIKSIEIVFSN